MQSLCRTDTTVNDHKRTNISKCFLPIPVATPQNSLPFLASSSKINLLSYTYIEKKKGICLKADLGQTRVWARNGIWSCPVLHADSNAVSGITLAHQSSAESRVRSPRSSIWHSQLPLKQPTQISWVLTAGPHKDRFSWGCSCKMPFTRKLFSLQAKEQHCCKSHYHLLTHFEVTCIIFLATATHLSMLCVLCHVSTK